MSVDLIKSYLIGIGFDVDEGSLSKTEKGMDRADKKVKEFNKDSTKGFSETGDSLKNLFTLLASGNILENLFPDMKGPLTDLIKGIVILKQVFKELNKEKPELDIEKNEKTNKDTINQTSKRKEDGSKKDTKEKPTLKENSKTEIKSKKPEFKEEKLEIPKLNENKSIKNKKVDKELPKNENPKLTKNEHVEKIKREVYEVKKVDVIKTERIKEAPKKVSKEDKIDVPKVETPKIDIPDIADKIRNQIGPIGDTIKGFVGQIGVLQTATSSLLAGSGVAISKFASAALGPIGMIVVAVTSAVGVVAKLSNALNKMASQDVAYEKLSRQLWTTKDDAKDVDSALKTLGATMEDLHASPTLLKQFNQLRKDSRDLRLPGDFKENMQVLQGVVLEFRRLKQMVTQFFQWVGHYILKYIKGPLNEIKRGMGSFNNGLMKVIPKVAKVFGSVLGVILRIMFAIGKVVGAVIKVLYYLTPIKMIFSVISGVVEFIKSIFDSIPGPLQTILKLIILIGIAVMAGPVGAILLLIMALEDLVNFFLGKKSFLGKLLGIDTDDDEPDLKPEIDTNDSNNSSRQRNINDKVSYFDENMNTSSSGSSAPQSYVTNNAQSTTSNNTTNNKVDNNNTINVYGTDPVATGRAVDKNLNGVQARNLQGAY